MYDLTDRYTLLKSLQPDPACAEIGVADGLLSRRIIELCNPVSLLLVDNWKHVSEGPYADDPANGPNQQYKDDQFEHVVSHFAPYPCVGLLRMDSIDAAAQQAKLGTVFDWVYLDADHTQVYQDMDAWFPLIRPGGWLVGHDYVNVPPYISVKTDVDRWAQMNGLSVAVTRGDRGDIYEKHYKSWIIQKP